MQGGIRAGALQRFGHDESTRPKFAVILKVSDFLQVQGASGPEPENRRDGVGAEPEKIDFTSLPGPET